MVQNLKSRSSLTSILFINYWFNWSENGIIKDSRVERAMTDVDRGNYCRNNPYMDAPQGIGYAVTISAPHMVSNLTTLFVNH